MSDTISTAINAVVASAIEAQIPAIIAAIASNLAKPSEVSGPDEFVRLNDVCALLKIHKTTAHRIALKGDLPAIEHLGKKACYRRSTLDGVMRRVGCAEQPVSVSSRSRKIRG
jgi:hypothetical protein